MDFLDARLDEHLKNMHNLRHDNIVVRPPLILLGAGSRQGAEFVLYAISNLNVVGAVDNSISGQSIGGLTVVDDHALPELVLQNPDAVAIMCGCTDAAVTHFLDVWRVYGRPLLSIFQAMRMFGCPGEWVCRQEHDIVKIREFWERTHFADPKSQETLKRVLLHYVTLERSWLDPIKLPLDSMYFQTDVFRIGCGEILLDGGAFDGDTIKAFKLITKDRFKQIHAFEADPVNISKLNVFSNDHRITVHPFALWNEDATLSFSSAGDSGSIVGGKGDLTICGKNFDAMELGAITIVKLDIEGAELPCLAGHGEDLGAL